MKIIELNNISKKYHKNYVLKDVTFDFEEGKSYLIVGYNGSGKTTLIKGILGLINFNSGSVVLKNKNISYLPERFVFPDFITVYEFLYKLGCIRNIKKDELINRISYLLNVWNLEGKKTINSLSKGMCQKVLIAQALLDDANLYIFDEPLNGLDVSMQNQFFYLIEMLRKLQKTIIISTHYPNYYINNSDYILSIENGKLYDKPN